MTEVGRVARLLSISIRFLVVFSIYSAQVGFVLSASIETDLQRKLLEISKTSERLGNSQITLREARKTVSQYRTFFESNKALAASYPNLWAKASRENDKLQKLMEVRESLNGCKTDANVSGAILQKFYREGIAGNIPIIHTPLSLSKRATLRREMLSFVAEESARDAIKNAIYYKFVIGNEKITNANLDQTKNKVYDAYCKECSHSVKEGIFKDVDEWVKTNRVLETKQTSVEDKLISLCADVVKADKSLFQWSKNEFTVPMDLGPENKQQQDQASCEADIRLPSRLFIQGDEIPVHRAEHIHRNVKVSLQIRQRNILAKIAAKGGAGLLFINADGDLGDYNWCQNPKSKNVITEVRSRLAILQDSVFKHAENIKEILRTRLSSEQISSIYRIAPKTIASIIARHPQYAAIGCSSIALAERKQKVASAATGTVLAAAAVTGVLATGGMLAPAAIATVPVVGGMVGTTGFGAAVLSLGIASTAIDYSSYRELGTEHSEELVGAKAGFVEDKNTIGKLSHKKNEAEGKVTGLVISAVTSPLDVVQVASGAKALAHLLPALFKSVKIPSYLGQADGLEYFPALSKIYDGVQKDKLLAQEFRKLSDKDQLKAYENIHEASFVGKDYAQKTAILQESPLSLAGRKLVLKNGHAGIEGAVGFKKITEKSNHPKWMTVRSWSDTEIDQTLHKLIKKRIKSEGYLQGLSAKPGEPTTWNALKLGALRDSQGVVDFQQVYGNSTATIAIGRKTATDYIKLPPKDPWRIEAEQALAMHEWLKRNLDALPPGESSQLLKESFHRFDSRLQTLFPETHGPVPAPGNVFMSNLKAKPKFVTTMPLVRPNPNGELDFRKPNLVEVPAVDPNGTDRFSIMAGRLNEKKYAKGVLLEAVPNGVGAFYKKEYNVIGRKIYESPYIVLKKDSESLKNLHHESVHGYFEKLRRQAVDTDVPLSRAIGGDLESLAGAKIKNNEALDEPYLTGFSEEEIYAKQKSLSYVLREAFNAKINNGVSRQALAEQLDYANFEKNLKGLLSSATRGEKANKLALTRLRKFRESPEAISFRGDEVRIFLGEIKDGKPVNPNFFLSYPIFRSNHKKLSATIAEQIKSKTIASGAFSVTTEWKFDPIEFFKNSRRIEADAKKDAILESPEVELLLKDMLVDIGLDLQIAKEAYKNATKTMQALEKVSEVNTTGLSLEKRLAIDMGLVTPVRGFRSLSEQEYQAFLDVVDANVNATKVYLPAMKTRTTNKQSKPVLLKPKMPKPSN